MKTIIKSIFLLLLAFTITNCDNDDGTAANMADCNFKGLTAEDSSNNTSTLIPGSDLSTEIFMASSEGPKVEIFGGTPFISFTTKAITLNATDGGVLIIDGVTYSVNVICQRAGTSVGDEFRFDITASGLEAEFCVNITKEIIRYVDADGDGFGSTTVATTYVAGGISGDNTDCDDTDPLVNPFATETANDGIDSNCDGTDNT